MKELYQKIPLEIDIREMYELLMITQDYLNEVEEENGELTVIEKELYNRVVVANDIVEKTGAYTKLILN